MLDINYLKAKKIKLLICDVDGVLTDGGLYFDKDGNELKRFHSQDGYGLQAIIKNGIEVAVISARNSPAVNSRMDNLGIKYYYQGQSDKTIALDKLMKKLKLNLAEIAYIGDDIIDLSIMTKIGWAVAVNNAVDSVKTYAHYITKKNGGNGAVREVCDMLLKYQNYSNEYMRPLHKHE